MNHADMVFCVIGNKKSGHINMEGNRDYHMKKHEDA